MRFAILSMQAGFEPASRQHPAGSCCRISRSSRSRDAALSICLNEVKGTGEKVSPPRKWICAAGWILSLLPASSFSSGRLSIDCVTRGSSESGATRMLAKSRVTALLKSSTRVDLF